MLNCYNTVQLEVLSGEKFTFFALAPIIMGKIFICHTFYLILMIHGAYMMNFIAWVNIYHHSAKYFQ